MSSVGSKFKAPRRITVVKVRPVIDLLREEVVYLNNEILDIMGSKGDLLRDLNIHAVNPEVINQLLCKDTVLERVTKDGTRQLYMGDVKIPKW